jgi:predicted nucleic acid-binding protein
MYYLDSNVFILPVLYEGPRSSRALDFLERTVKGEIKAATSTLTLDEVVYILSKRSSREIALRQAVKILGFPHLRILDVKKADISLALEKMGGNDRLFPRDAIHLSVALNNGFTNIVSDDDDFSKLEGIIHIPLSDDRL